MYHVDFHADFTQNVARGQFDIVEITRAKATWVNPPTPLIPQRIHYNGSHLVLPLGPEHTANNTYSTTEVASSRRFDQAQLDRFLAHGSPRVMVPGRQAIFKDIVFSPHFADGRANDETVTSGIIFQSWRGIEDVEHHPDDRPAYIGVTLGFIGGPGLLAKLATRSRRRARSFVAAIFDFNIGLQWLMPLPDFDPSEPHDIILRWLPQRDVMFIIDGRTVAHYVDGSFHVSPLALFRKYRRQVNILGYRHLTADPCHIDCWVNCSTTGTRPEVNSGRQFKHDLWVALKGFAIEPIM